MSRQNNAAPEVKALGRSEAEESKIRCHAGKEVVKKWLIKSTHTEAYQKLKTVESILETLQENGIGTVEAALESVRLASSVSMYLCKDGIYAQERAFKMWLAECERSDGSDNKQHIG